MKQLNIFNLNRFHSNHRRQKTKAYPYPFSNGNAKYQKKNSQFIVSMQFSEKKGLFFSLSIPNSNYLWKMQCLLLQAPTKLCTSINRATSTVNSNVNSWNYLSFFCLNSHLFKWFVVNIPILFRIIKTWAFKYKKQFMHFIRRNSFNWKCDLF